MFAIYAVLKLPRCYGIHGLVSYSTKPLAVLPRLHNLERVSELQLSPRSDWERSLASEQLLRLRQMQFRYEFWRVCDASVPETVSEKEWEEILTSERRKLRRQLLLLNLKQKRRFQLSVKNELQRQEYAERVDRLKELICSVGINKVKQQYGSHRTTLLHHTKQAFISQCMNTRILAARRNSADSINFAIDLNSDLVFRYDTTAIACRLSRLFRRNMDHKMPVQMHFLCNPSPLRVDKWQSALNLVEKGHGGVSPEFYASLNNDPSEFYTQVGAENVVYIISDAAQVITELDSRKTYVVPIFNEYPDVRPAVLKNVKSINRNVSMARLPLDLYVKWGRFGRDISATEILGILLDMQLHGNWRQAIKDNVSFERFRL